MAIQLQIRRGTTAENDLFTGAVGELTMDTDTKGIRLHDGSTQGGVQVPTADTSDYVVEWQVPTDLNNYTWYRKYKSGWVEQGGIITVNKPGANSAVTTTVNLPVTMANENYYVAPLTFITDGGNTTGLRNHNNIRGTTTLKIGTYSTMAISNNYTAAWEVKGIAA